MQLNKGPVVTGASRSVVDSAQDDVPAVRIIRVTEIGIVAVEKNHIPVVGRIIVVIEHDQGSSIDIDVVGLCELAQLINPVALGRHDVRHLGSVSLAQDQVGPAVGGGKADVRPPDRLPVNKHGGIGGGINAVHGSVPIEIGLGDDSADPSQNDDAAAHIAHPAHAGHGVIGAEIRLHQRNVVGPDLSRSQKDRSYSITEYNKSFH